MYQACRSALIAGASALLLMFLAGCATPINKFVAYRPPGKSANLGGGLRIKPGDDKLKGFIVAGADKEWVWADAVIEGNTIVVSSPDVPLPKYVRYGWAWNPVVNLINAEGLPAIPFRTDE